MNNGNKKVEIIVCVHNNESVIEKCLKSIEQQTHKKYRCTVVDDCSSDKTIDTVKKKFSWVYIIKKKKRTGPAASRNMAIKKTKADLIVTIDSDVQLSKTWLSEQVKFMKNETVGIAASKILYSWDKKKMNSAGGSSSLLGFGFDRCNKMKKDDCKEIVPVLYGHSAAMVVRKKMLDEVGDFDETYFYGNEDTDIGWRANIAGWKVLYNPKAVAYHDENVTIKTMGPAVAFHGTKNRIRSVTKNFSCSRVAIYLPVHIFAILVNVLVSGPRGAKLRGLIWNVIHITSTIRERKRVQSTRKIKDDDILFYLFDKRLTPMHSNKP